MTYNQASYIIDTLDGFCIQETNFPYVCTIFDDASTDGEQDVIKHYLHDHFDLEDKTIVRTEETKDYSLIFAPHKTNSNCYFAVLFLKYNHYSIKKDKLTYISEWTDNSKYTALCEGDDYWISSSKLQKQFDYMESHPECSMCFHPNYRLFPNGSKTINKPHIVKERYNAEDIILGGGGMMAYNSMFYRKIDDVYDNRPAFWKNSPVGDVPMRLYLASKGNVGYIDEVMSVYRKGIGSWTVRNQKISVRIETTKAQQRVLDGYDEFTNYQYHKAIVKGNILNWLRCMKMILMILKNKIKVW